MNQNEDFEFNGFPKGNGLRRLRRTPAIRDLLQETRLSVKILSILFLFKKELMNQKK